jgi:hypothetical protein
LTAGQGIQFIKFLEPEYGRLLNKNMLAGFEGQFGGFEMAIVRRSDTDGIDAMSQKLVDCMGPGEIDKLSYAARRNALVLFSPRSCPAGHRGQFHFNETKVFSKKPGRVQLFEKGTVSFVENHAEADHAGPETVLG